MKYFKIILLIPVLIACGPTATENAAKEKQRMDSVVQATEEATKLKLETKVALQDSIKTINSDIENQEARLSSLKGELAVARDKMDDIREFEIGRTRSEREQQIKDQTIKITDLEQSITKLEKQISESNSKLATFQEQLKQYQ